MQSIARSKYHPSQELPSFGRPAQGTKPYVVVVFGRTGVGISSLVNLIAGHPVSNVHPNAKTSTPKIKPHPPIALPGSQKQFSLYELPGFGGKFRDAAIMEAIRYIERQEGIDLFLYCLRPQKSMVLSKVVRQIRDSFSAPMIAVVTELERFGGTDTVSARMEDWWCTSLEGGTNGMQIEHMCFGEYDGFNAHACVTTLPPRETDLRESFRKRRDASEDCIRRLILEQCDRPKRRAFEPSEPPRHCLSALASRLRLRI